MIAALLFAAMSLQGGVRTVELSHGALIQSADSTAEPFGYWDSNDTYIDGSAPDQIFGGEPILAVGPSKTLLIRFGDLNRVLGSTRRIRKATLVLTMAGGDTPALKTVDKILVPWGSGPYFTIGALLKQAASHASDDPKPVNQKPVIPRLAATWRHRLSGEGGATWQQAGANGAQDSETIKEAHATVGDKEVAVTGLTAALQEMADHPNTNFGFGLQFQTACEFYSSRAAIGHPRLELELDSIPTASGPDLSVTSIQRITASGANPKDGEDVTYTAHIKNVGTGNATGFKGQWYVNDRPTTEVDKPEAIASGVETVVSMHKPYRLDKTDHRTQYIEFRITPRGQDSVSGNNALKVYENAKTIDVQVPAELANNVPLNLVGSTAVEDWVQEQVRVFNDTYAAQSRFSFAPDGVKERISIQHILIGDAKATDGAHADGVAVVPASEKLWLSSDNAFFRSIGLAIGIPDYTSMSFPAGNRVQLKFGDKVVARASTDLYPGVVGFGDTRNESALAGPISLVYEPYKPLTSGMLPILPSGLLSATDVALLNGNVEHVAEPLTMPKTSLIKATDLVGHPLGNAQLDFFQSKDGVIPDGPPTFSASTSSSQGTAILPTRGGFGPFGKLSPDGSNGTFLIRATANGATEWGWLKAWQLIDMASRGNTMAGVIEVRFDLPSAPLDSSVDLARDRIITDSTNILPAKIGTLVSGTADKEVTLGGKKGDWVEIDLGRDRTIGEISLLGGVGAFWPQFDIMVYGTGQNAADAAPWAHELNWNWTSSNRRDLVGTDPNIVSVAYRSLSVRIRFIRIVNRSSFPGKLSGIKVIPIKI